MEFGSKQILACPPTNMNEVLAGEGLPRYVPTTGHTLMQCQNPECGQDMWIGPRQKAVLNIVGAEAAVALCMKCGLSEHLRRGGDLVGHLGGNDGRPRL